MNIENNKVIFQTNFTPRNSHLIKKINIEHDLTVNADVLEIIESFKVFLISFGFDPYLISIILDVEEFRDEKFWNDYVSGALFENEENFEDSEIEKEEIENNKSKELIKSVLKTANKKNLEISLESFKKQIAEKDEFALYVFKLFMKHIND